MVGNTDHLSPVDRASVLKIIEDWNNPVVIDLEGAKRIRGIEASPDRVNGRRTVRDIISDAYRMPELDLEISRRFSEAPRLESLNLNEYFADVFSLMSRRQAEAILDPLAGTFVRGGWRRRRIYPHHHHMDALGYASEMLPNFIPVPGMFYPFQYP